MKWDFEGLLLCGEIYFVFCIKKIEEKFMMYFCQGYFSNISEDF